MDLMERAVADYEAELECADYEGYQRGVEEGRQSGVEEERQRGVEEGYRRILEIARDLLIEKISINIIQRVTGLDMEIIKELQAQMNN
jgi:predicted transposase YdaD